MHRHAGQTALLILLAALFTAGLTFATIELPMKIDAALQSHVTTPGFDSHADAVSRLKTDLFIAHFHLRTIGYLSFTALLILIGAGFATRRAGLAMLGGLAFMLPVFAQFAGVMFFLAGLGLLNVMWLPLLDISLDISRLGLVIRAPFDLLRWILGLAGVNGYWPITLTCIAAGLLIFFLGTFAWLQARVRGEPVATGWVYRCSRHPQYLGWILWSYGMFLLIELHRYPKRSWGISAALPWLLGTMIIIAVALLEEVSMRRDHPDAYGRYARSAPFLFPVPRVVTWMLTLPNRLLFGHSLPVRRREVAAIVAIYTAALMGLSAVGYDGAIGRLRFRLMTETQRSERLAAIGDALRTADSYHRRRALMDELVRAGDAGLPTVMALFTDEDAGLRAMAIERAPQWRDPRVIISLTDALGDPNADVRSRALHSLSAISGPEQAPSIRPLLTDPEGHIRQAAAGILASWKVPAALPVALAFLDSPNRWDREAALGALGSLAMPETIEAIARCLGDDEPPVRRAAVIALLRCGAVEGRRYLAAASADPDWEVRLYAAEALKRLR